MAPISTELVSLALAEQPEAAFISLFILLILSITLLLICTTCKKRSFRVEEIPEKERSSTLVNVTNGGAGGGRHNPAVNEITMDEIGGNLDISQDGMAYKPYRSHTLTHDSSLSTDMNGKAGVQQHIQMTNVK